MTDPKPSHSYLSCAEVARRLGLSRQRFWQLRRDGVFPQPQHDEETGRPYYTEEQFNVCADLRKRNVGLNGRVVLFYSARTSVTSPGPKKRKSQSKSNANNKHQTIIDSLKALGLPGITDGQVEDALKKLFPTGTADADHGEVVRAVFLHIQRQHPSGNQG